MRFHRAWSFLIGFACLATIAFPQSGQGSPAPQAARAGDSLGADPRLGLPVDLQRPRAYLAEVIQDLENQSHVPLSVDTGKGNVDGLPLALYIKNIPLRTVLNGIVEVLSSPFDQWEWQPSKGGRNGYILRHQRQPSAAAEAARRSMLQRWLVSLKACVDLSRLPDDARELAVKGHPELFAPGYPEHGKLDVLSAVNSADLETLATGGFVPLDPSRLSGRAATQLEKNLSGRQQRKTPGLFISWGPKSTGPTLWLRDREGGAENVIGGLLWDSDWYRTESRGWKYRGDEEVERLFRPIRMEDPAAGKWVSARSVPEWLGTEWRAHATNIIAVLDYPQAAVQLTRAWLGPDARTTMCAVVIDQEMVWRPLNNLHLLRYSETLTHPRNYLVAWSQIRALRDVCEASGGFLGIDQLSDLSELSSEQRASLAEEFPDAENRQLPDWSPIFQLPRNMIPERRAELASQAGARVADIGLLPRNILLGGEDPQDIRALTTIARHPREATISLRVEDTTTARGTRRRELVWEVRAPGEPNHRRILGLAPQRPLKPARISDLPLVPTAPKPLSPPG